MSIFNSKKNSGGYTPDLVKRGGERQKTEEEEGMRYGCWGMDVPGSHMQHGITQCTIRYDTRCYFNVRSKADMAVVSQLNLPHGTT